MSEKCTFKYFGIHSMLLEDLEGPAYMVNVVLHRAAIYQNIIQKNYNKLIQLLPKDLMH